jgi:hypothetical protein
MRDAQDISAQAVPNITYTPRADATPESELAALVTTYKFVLFGSQASKGGPHDVTHEVATDWRKQKVQGKVRKDRK